MHHTSIRTANIHRAIAFYQLLGFVVEERFSTGYTLACWMTGWHSRIELIQIPQPRPAADAFGDEHYTGYYHLSFDLADRLNAETPDLPTWLDQLQAKFCQEAEQHPDQVQPLTVLLEPTQQMIGDRVYEVAFVADADGLPLEFLFCVPPRT